MIKFFRHIRKSMIKDNKASKYLVYAIGEIALVVIGILIALSINNWNDQKKLILEEQEVIRSLTEELRGNIEKLKDAIKVNTRIEKLTTKVIDSLRMDVPKIKEDSFIQSTNYIPTSFETFVLQDVISSDGKLKTTDKTLIKKLRKLYSDFSEIEKSEFYLDELYNSKITEFFIDMGISFSQDNQMKESISLDNKTKYSRKQFISILNIKEGLFYIWLLNHKIALKDSEKLLNELKTLSND